MKNIRETVAWKDLEEHFFNIKNLKMRDFFKYDEERAKKYSFEFEDLFFDFSKNRMNFDTLVHFKSLCKSVKLNVKKELLFSGDIINKSEVRAALHVAYRYDSEINTYNIDESLLKKVIDIRENLLNTAKKINSKKEIKNIVHIGIGGSVGPVEMVCNALDYYKNNDRKFYFVSNVDDFELCQILERVNLKDTIFIIASKSMTTLETINNLRVLRDYFKLGNELEENFYAITENQLKAEELGFIKGNILKLDINIGGRYSIWSYIGLTLLLKVGEDNFLDFVKGAAKIDEHFYTSDELENIPAILAFIDIWYRDFFDIRAKAVIPYESSLKGFVPYLQQLEMESNGKLISNDGNMVNYATAPIIFGGVGTDVQHSFMQLIHQGIDIVPVDFMVGLEGLGEDKLSHLRLFANCIAQSEALMKGRDEVETNQELEEQGLDNETISRLIKQRIFFGNIPSNMIVYKKMTPKVLGMLMAIYEHKVFVEAMIWNINPFDQFGVELGKNLNSKIENELKDKNILEHDSSTKQLLKMYLDKNI